MGGGLVQTRRRQLPGNSHDPRATKREIKLIIKRVGIYSSPAMSYRKVGDKWRVSMSGDASSSRSFSSGTVEEDPCDAVLPHRKLLLTAFLGTSPRQTINSLRQYDWISLHSAWLHKRVVKIMRCRSIEALYSLVKVTSSFAQMTSSTSSTSSLRKIKHAVKHAKIWYSEARSPGKKSLVSILEYFSRNNAIVKPQTPLPMSICLKKKTAHRNAKPS
jgi:hypothetical protein